MAAYPVASGRTSKSGSLIPQLFASEMQIAFYKRATLAHITTTEYEGQLKNHGDKLTINLLPDVDFRDYVIGQDLIIQTPEGSSVSLEINKGKYWAIATSDIEKAQSHIAYAKKWGDHAGKGMAVSIEASVYSDVYSEAGISGATAGADSDINLGSSGAPLVLTAATIVAVLANIEVTLADNNIPEEDRWILLPPWATAMLTISEFKDVSVTGAGGESPMVTGFVKKVETLSVYRTTNLTKVTDGNATAYNAMFGWKGAIAFATQTSKTEMDRNHKDFGDVNRSLQSYGYKVVMPEALGHLYISKVAASQISPSWCGVHAMYPFCASHANF